MNNQRKRKSNKLKVKLYELNDIREIEIDLSNGKDRGKLKHILAHEKHRLKKRDIRHYEDILNRSSL